MSQQKANAAASGAGGAIIEWLSGLGYKPHDLPAPAEQLQDPGLPGAAGLAAKYARTAPGLELLLSHPEIWAIGPGIDPKTGETAIALVIEPKQRDAAEAKLGGQRVSFAGTSFPFVLHEMERRLRFTQGSAMPAKPPFMGARTGSFCSTDPNGILTGSGATLSGTFHSVQGHGERFLTNAHVPLDLDFNTLLNGLPGTLGQLLTASPKNKRLIVWDDGGGFMPSVVQGSGPGEAYVIGLVDTDTPILEPLVSLAAIVLGSPILPVLYVDVAAGPVQPQPVSPGPFSPPAPTPVRTTVRGAHLGLGRTTLWGDHVYRIGTTTGTVWGNSLGPAFFIPVPTLLPPPLPVMLLIGPVDLYDITEKPGDSGAFVTLMTDNRPLSIQGAQMATTYQLIRAFGDVDV